MDPGCPDVLQTSDQNMTRTDDVINVPGTGFQPELWKKCLLRTRVLLNVPSSV
jgi:hypothetical protein